MKKIVVVLNIFIFLLVVGLFGAFYYLFKRVDELSNSIPTQAPSETISEELNAPTGVEGEGDFEALIDERVTQEVSKAISTISGETKTVVKEVPVEKSNSGVDYISMGGTFSTKSTDWVTVPDSGVYIDLYGDYGEGAKVSWEATLKIISGSGKAYARLYDETNKIAVDYSEVSSEDNLEYQLVTSGALPFWRGRNLYKVQIKSLNSFEVAYGGGKIKIIYGGS